MARDEGCSALIWLSVCRVFTLRKALNDRFGVPVHAGIVRRIVRTVVPFGYKIITLRSVIMIMGRKI